MACGFLFFFFFFNIHRVGYQFDIRCSLHYCFPEDFFFSPLRRWEACRDRSVCSLPLFPLTICKFTVHE